MSKNQQQSQRVVEHDGFDDLAFEGVAHYDKILDICRDEVATDVVKDVFTSFYRTEPKVDEEKQSLLKDVMSELHKMKEFTDFHQTSQLDGVSSALGSIQMSPSIIEKLNEIKKQIEQQRQEQQEQNKENGKDPNDGVPQGEPRLEELSQEGQAGLRQSFRKAIEKAQEQAEEVQGQMRSWGLDAGEVKDMDPSKVLQTADLLNRAGRLKNVSNLIGRFKNVVNSALATTPSHGMDELIDIGPGDDLNRVVPSELAKLVYNEDLFFKDLLEKNLTVYNLKGTENLGKGPLIVCFDRSGSMDGSRIEWAVSVVVALMHLAQKENRAFAWISFDSSVHDSAFFKKGQKISLEEKIRVAKTGCSGGTDFWKPLTKAMKLHEQEPDLKPADLVFITDGEYELSEDQVKTIQDWKKQKDVRIFGVGITNSFNSDIASLEDFCNQVCMVNDLGDVSPLKQIVQATHKGIK